MAGVVLAIDVGGSHVKVLVNDGETEPRRAKSGPEYRPEEMVEAVKDLAGDWEWETASIGIPAPVHGGRIAADPVNLGKGWAGFDYGTALGRPTRVVNDAAMQALGTYDGDGRMLFLGLGTGLGSALVADGWVQPMELGHLPFRKASFEHYVGRAGLERNGKKEWRKDVDEVVATLSAALRPDYVVLGGGNAKFIKEPPENARIGRNDNSFIGGFRLWDEHAPARIAG